MSQVQNRDNPSPCRLVVGAMDTILAFDATDNRFEKIDQVATIDNQKRASCIGEQDRKDVSTWREKPMTHSTSYII